MMFIFNSYTVYDEAGYLLASGRSAGEGVAGNPKAYFNSLSADIQRCADVLLVLQESGFVARYRVEQPTVPEAMLGPRERLEAETF